ncbi:hypothetical protein MRX96_058820 [Rhipicephalus microplus]
MEQRMRERGEQAKLHADEKRESWRDFREGDQVLVKGLRPDDDKWLLGTIAQRCSACTYIVCVEDEDRYVHADNLRLCTFQENQSWLKAQLNQQGLLPSLLRAFYMTAGRRSTVVSRTATPRGQSTPQLRRSTRFRRPPDRYVP